MENLCQLLFDGKPKYIQKLLGIIYSRVYVSIRCVVMCDSQTWLASDFVYLAMSIHVV